LKRCVSANMKKCIWNPGLTPSACDGVCAPFGWFQVSPLNIGNHAWSYSKYFLPLKTYCSFVPRANVVEAVLWIWQKFPCTRDKVSELPDISGFKAFSKWVKHSSCSWYTFDDMLDCTTAWHGFHSTTYYIVFACAKLNAKFHRWFEKDLFCYLFPGICMKNDKMFEENGSPGIDNVAAWVTAFSSNPHCLFYCFN